ncbi:MAG TPA: hypothetical protein VND43_01735 [Burkholderiales bacterium]|nr:hypothetical protein [Burkholderiales bacterium]
MNPVALTSKLFAALCNRLLENQPGVASALATHSPEVFSVECPPLRLGLHIEADGRLVADDPFLASTSIVVRPFGALLVHAGVAAPSQAFFVSGSEALAYAFGGIFEELDLQAEDALSDIFGPVFANEFIKASREFVSWQKETFRRSFQLVAGYAVERRVIAGRREIGEFIRNVDELRDRLARLEKRLDRLSRNDFRNVGTSG